MSVKEIYPVKGLRGEVTIPGDKSISHRSIMLGAISLGTTEITHFLKGADCLSTIDCFRKMKKHHRVSLSTAKDFPVCLHLPTF